MDDLTHIASSFEESDLFATGEFETKVAVWSLRKRTKIVEFDTVLDYGGRRLAWVKGEDPIVVAGGYVPGSIVGHDALTGDELWRRDDMKKIQSILPVPGTTQVAAGFDERPMLILDAATGETVTTFKGAEDCFVSPYAPLALLFARSGRVGFRCCAMPVGEVVWKAKLTTFASLDAAFSPDAVLVSESAGPARCFDLSGRELWRVPFAYGRHAVRLSWCEPAGEWHAVVWDFDTGGEMRLYRISKDGTYARSRRLVRAEDFGPLARGRYLISTSGQLMEMPGTRVKWTFARVRPGRVLADEDIQLEDE